MNITEAWNSGRRPKYTKGDNWILPLDGKRWVALSNGSKLTAKGKVLRDAGLWVESDLNLDLYQRPVTRGNSEYLTLHSGRQVLGRTWKQGNWSYTQRGKDFYSRSAQIVVNVPCIIVGTAADFESESYLPVSSATISGLSEEYVRGGAEATKEHILRAIGRKRIRTVALSFSKEAT